MTVRLGWSRVEWGKDAGPKAWWYQVKVRGHSSAKAIGRTRGAVILIGALRSESGMSSRTAVWAFGESAPSRDAEVLDDRLVILGDDASGKALEVLAVEGPKGELIVIHAMELREKYREQYKEAKQWRL
jgi:hypothetical protein